MNRVRYSAELVKRAHTSFYWAFVFLPAEKREAIFTAYAFARQTDDLVDEASSLDVARADLARWHDELLACYAGRPTHPITRDLAIVLEQFPIPRDYFEKLIEGCAMDLDRTRYDSFDDLAEYCYRVASVIGLISIEIFGYRSPQTKEYAEHLGMALQLTNILRDVREDAARGRIYLPLDELSQFSCSENDILSGNVDDNWRNLMAFQSNRAQSYYDTAATTLPDEDRKSMFSAEIMGRIYHEILLEIRRRDYVIDERVRIGGPRKLSIAIRYWLQSLTRNPGIGRSH